MEKIDQSTIDLVCKTILIGMPAVGKTTLTEELAKQIKEQTGVELEAVSSDFKFRAVRRNPDSPIVQNFMKTHHIPQEDFPLIIKTADFIKKYGEESFRDLESDVVVDMLQNGEFEGKIPNLGGKAMLHSKTAEAFKKAGYYVIHLDSDVSTLTKNVVKDFNAMLDGATITRSATNGEIMDAVKEESPEYAAISPNQFIENRIQKTRAALKTKNPAKAIRQAEPNKLKKLKAYLARVDALNKKAFDIMLKMNNERADAYHFASDEKFYRSGDLEKDTQDLLRMIKQRDIRSIIPGINEVVPYTYAEQKQHHEIFDPIITQMLSQVPSSENPELVHMLGIPGAGKTTFYKNNKDKYADYIYIAFDNVMEHVPQYHEDIEKHGSIEAFKNWELPARIAGYELLRRAVKERKNIFFDHGGTPACHQELIQNIKEQGYITHMFFIDCPVEIALKRAEEREKITKRHTPPQMIKDRVALIESNKPKFKKLVDDFREF